MRRDTRSVDRAPTVVVADLHVGEDRAVRLPTRGLARSTRLTKTRPRRPADPLGRGGATLIALIGQPHRPFWHAIHLKVSPDTRTDVAEATPEARRAGRQRYYASAATVSGDSASSESLSSSATTPARNR